MKPRDFKLDAYELCRRFQSPGHLELAIAAQKHGYQLGLLDATKRFKEAADEIRDKWEKSTRPN